MPNTAKDFLRASDNADAYAASLIEGIEQKAHEDIDRLFSEIPTRDVELWTELGVDPVPVVQDYGAVPVDERGLDWVEGLAGLSAASGTQFFLDNRETTIIKPVAYREQVVGTLVLTQAELVKAGKRGVDVVVDVERFAVLQAKYVDELSFLAEMDNIQLHRTLRELNALRPIEQEIAAQSGYVSRMTRYRAGSPQWTAEVNSLINSQATGQLKWANRRAVESLYSFREADGDLGTLMVWIGESSKPCPYCAALFGEVDTYGNWIDRGLPGADICEGGDR